MINYLYNTKTKTLKKLRAYRTKEIQVPTSKLIWILADNKIYSLAQITKLYYGKCSNKEQVKSNLKKLSKILKIEEITRTRYGREMEHEYKLVDRVWITNE